MLPKSYSLQENFRFPVHATHVPLTRFPGTHAAAAKREPLIFFSLVNPVIFIHFPTSSKKDIYLAIQYFVRSPADLSSFSVFDH